MISQINDPIQKNKAVRKIIKNDIYEQKILEFQISYANVQKKNNSGLMHNLRFLIICFPQYIGYLNQISQKINLPFQSIQSIPKPKKSFKFDQFSSVNIKSTTVQIKYKINQNGKQKQQCWYMKCQSDNMSKKLAQIIKVSVQKFKQKKNQLIQQARKQNSKNKTIVQYTVKQQYKKIEQEQKVGKKNQLSSNNEQIQNEDEINYDERSESKRGRYGEIQVSKKQKHLEDLLNKQLQKQKEKNQRRNLNREAILEVIKDEWNYKYFISNSKQEIILNFKKQGEKIMKDLIDQKCLPLNMRNYKPITKKQEFQVYNVYNIKVILAFSNLIYTQNQENVYDQSSIKILNNQFKNYLYIFNHIKQLPKLQVPLAMIIQYKGIIGLLKANINKSKYQNKQFDIQPLLEQLSVNTKIDKSIFDDDQSLKIVSINAKLYENFYWAQSQYNLKPLQQFEIYYFEDVMNYLPQDLYNIQNFKQKKLRPEFIIKDHIQQNIFFAHQLDPNDKIQKNLIKKRQITSSKITDILQQIIIKWQDNDIIIVNSQQLSQLLHENGLNIRYLGQLYKTASLINTKRIIMSEIAARSIKIILRNNCQQIICEYPKQIKSMKLNKSEIIEECDKYLKEMVMDILNTIFISSAQNILIWQIIGKQAKQSFNININQNDILQGYLLQAIEYNCRILFDWKQFKNQIKLFDKNIQYFNTNSIKSFQLHTKHFPIHFTQIYKTLSDLLNIQSKQNFEKIVQLLQLHNYTIPKTILASNLINKLYQYLSKFIHSFQNQDNPFQHLSIDNFVNSQPLSISKINIFFNRLKYHLSKNNINQSLKIFQNIHSRAVRWFGDFNIISGKLYDIISDHYQRIGQYQNALALAKSSLVNNLHLYGQQSLKLVKNYCMIGGIFLKRAKKDDALMFYQKGKILLENNEQNKSIKYANICLNLAFILLNMKKYNQVIQLSQQSIQIYQQNNKQNEYQKQLTQNYQILMNCFNKLKNGYKCTQLGSHCQDIVIDIKEGIYFERTLKICLIPKLDLLQNSKKKLMKKVIELIVQNEKPQDFVQSAIYLRQKIENKKYFEMMDQVIENIEQIYRQILDRKVKQQEEENIFKEQIEIFRRSLNFLGNGYFLQWLQIWQ